MTNEQNRRIAEKLAGYEVQVSPAGKHYIVTDEGTSPMPDWETNEVECTSTADAICRSRGGGWSMGRDRYIGAFGSVNLPTGGVRHYGEKACACLAHCLLQIAEGEE